MVEMVGLVEVKALVWLVGLVGVVHLVGLVVATGPGEVTGINTEPGMPFTDEAVSNFVFVVPIQIGEGEFILWVSSEPFSVEVGLVGIVEAICNDTFDLCAVGGLVCEGEVILWVALVGVGKPICEDTLASCVAVGRLSEGEDIFRDTSVCGICVARPGNVILAPDVRV